MDKEKSAMVAVTSTNDKGEDKVQMLDRSYVEKFNIKNAKTGKKYVVSEEKTKTYYKSKSGKAQTIKEKRENAAIEVTAKRASKPTSKSTKNN